MITYRRTQADDIYILIEMRIQFLAEHQGDAGKENQDELRKNLGTYFYHIVSENQRVKKSLSILPKTEKRFTDNSVSKNRGIRNWY